jgi:hypothetical protein
MVCRLGVEPPDGGAGNDMPSEPAPLVVIRPPGAEPYTLTLDQLTAHVRAARVLRMGRLSKILAKATDAQVGLEMAVERDVQKYVERVQEVHSIRERTFLDKHFELDGHVTDLSEFKEDLEAFGKNEHSGSKDGDAYTGTRKV